MTKINCCTIILFHRLMRYNIQIISFTQNGSCYQLNDGNVSLYYRIGTSSPWRILTSHAANGTLSMYVFFGFDSILLLMGNHLNKYNTDCGVRQVAIHSLHTQIKYFWKEYWNKIQWVFCHHCHFNNFFLLYQMQCIHIICDWLCQKQAYVLF